MLLLVNDRKEFWRKSLANRVAMNFIQLHQLLAELIVLATWNFPVACRSPCLPKHRELIANRPSYVTILVEVRVDDPAAIQRTIQKTIQKAIHARSRWIALDRLAFLERLRSRSKRDPAQIQKTIQFYRSLRRISCPSSNREN